MSFEIKKILIVCVGNICRSPMAQGMLKEKLKNRGIKDFEVESAGLEAVVGSPPDPMAQELMKAEGIDISHQRARQLLEDNIKWAHLILAMNKNDKKLIERHFPIARGKIFRLGEWSDIDVPDPYRKSKRVFMEAREAIRSGIEGWLRNLQNV